MRRLPSVFFRHLQLRLRRTFVSGPRSAVSRQQLLRRYSGNDSRPQMLTL